MYVLFSSKGSLFRTVTVSEQMLEIQSLDEMELFTCILFVVSAKFKSQTLYVHVYMYK